MKKLFFSLIILLVCMHMYADDTASKKALLFTSTDFSTSDRWYKTVSSTQPGLLQVKSVVQGQKFLIVVLILDYTVKFEKAEVTYDLTVTAPDGSVYLNKMNIPAIDSKIQNKMVMMANGLMWISFDPEDQFGTYKIDIAVHDILGTEDYRLSTDIECKKEISGKSFSHTDEFANWLTYYYKKPEPERLMDAVSYYINSPLSKDNKVLYPVMGFFVASFRDNLYLIDTVASRFFSLSEQEQVFYLYLFNYLENEKAEQFLDSMSGKLKDYIAKVRKNHKPWVLDPVANPTQLDFLWGSFFGSGRYEYILALVKALDLKESKAAIFGAAQWSIGSNCEQHQLVQHYCDYIFQNEPLSKTVKSELGLILKK